MKKSRGKEFQRFLEQLKLEDEHKDIDTKCLKLAKNTRFGSDRKSLFFYASSFKKRPQIGKLKKIGKYYSINQPKITSF